VVGVNGYLVCLLDPGDDLSQCGNMGAQGCPALRSQRDPRGSATAVNSFAAPGGPGRAGRRVVADIGPTLI